MLADPICCWDHTGLPVLLIERRRDGSGVIIRNCVITQQSREDLSRLHFTNPVQPDPPPKERKRRRDDDGQALLRYTIRQNPNTLHAMAQEMGLSAAVADEVLQELFQSVGEAPPQPVLRRARCNRGKAQSAASEPAIPASDGARGLVTPVEQLQPPAPPEQRSAALRSEAMRDEALSSRLAAVRLRDLSASRCPRVREGYAWFIRQQHGAAQSKLHSVTEMTVATL